MLRDHDSSDFHISTVRRHIRFCRQFKGAEKYATRIEPVYQELISKQAITKSEKEKRQDAYDDVILYDTAFDNSVRTVFEKCQQFDREHVSEIVLKKIFPEEKYGHIVKMPYAEEPAEVEKIVIRIENLSADHPLYPLAAELREKITKCQTAITNHHEAIRQHKRVEAEEEIAQAKLRQVYENNYLDARKEFGKVNVEQLFPQTGSNTKTEPAPPAENQSNN
ncbi:hypothetical protein JW964_10485 [candidate division KSB1 bacterium]|nr:hypothetical protein [candidate division KSB1 bacterium]